MSRLKRVTAPNGQDYWVDEHGIVHGVVRTGQPREDTKEYEEREPVEAFLRHLGWETPRIERHPAGQTESYDFDCTDDSTGERAAIELKRVAPKKLMRAAATGDDVEVNLAAMKRLPAELMTKANDQLADAPRGARRCALLVWMQEDDFFWQHIRSALEALEAEDYENLDEVWLTSAHFRRWVRAGNKTGTARGEDGVR